MIKQNSHTRTHSQVSTPNKNEKKKKLSKHTSSSTQQQQQQQQSLGGHNQKNFNAFCLGASGVFLLHQTIRRRRRCHSYSNFVFLIPTTFHSPLLRCCVTLLHNNKRTRLIISPGEKRNGNNNNNNIPTI
jgi:hypothetical protein